MSSTAKDGGGSSNPLYSDLNPQAIYRISVIQGMCRKRSSDSGRQSVDRELLPISIYMMSAHQLRFNPFRLKVRAFLVALWITFFGLLSLAQTQVSADPLKLVSRHHAQVRCEIIFTNFANFVQNRQRVLLTPLQDPALDARFHNWLEKLNSILKLPDPYRADFDEIGVAIDRLSEVDKSAVLKEVASFYKEVTAEKYRALKLKELKRTLDLILSRAGRPDRLFENAKEGVSAWGIYKEYFENTRKGAGLESDYTAQDVWSLLHWIKRRLQSEQKAIPALGGAEIVIYGSYINGRAILKSSDIDAIADSNRTSAFVDRLNDDPYFKKFDVDHIAANSSQKFSEWSAAQLSPVLFVVSAESVIMKVYPPMTYSEVSSKKTSRKPYTFIYD